MQKNRWTCIAKDNTLTGNAHIKGDIVSEPQPFFSMDNSKKYVYITAARGEDSDLRVSAAGELQTRNDLQLYAKWEAGFPEFHKKGEKPLFNEYDKVPYYIFGRVGHFIPEIKELQWLDVDTCFDSPMASRTRAAQNEDEQLFARLRILKNGQWENLWETANIDWLAYGQPAIGDFDGDGREEVVITPWYTCRFYDLRTGQEKYVCRAVPDGTESGRVYGLTMAVDVDGDGRDEAVTFCGLENHVSMLKYVDGQIQKIWSNLYERGTMRKKSVVHLIQEPVVDINRDGIKEVCLPIYNLTDDHQWHILVLDGMTGVLKEDYPGFYLKQIKTIDGTAYLFGYKTESFEQGNHIQILKSENNSLKVVFDKTGYFPETSISQPKPKLGHFPLRGIFKLADIEDERGLAFFVHEGEGANARLNLYRVSGSQFMLDGSISSTTGIGTISTSAQFMLDGGISSTAGIEIVSAMSHHGTALLRLRLPREGAATLAGKGLKLEFLGRTAVEFLEAQPLVADFADGVTRVFIQSDGGTIDAFSVEGDTLKRNYSVNGRGNAYMVAWDRGPMLVDMDGQGNFALTAFTSEAGSQGALTAFDKNGEVIWKRLIEGAPFETLSSFCKGKLKGDAGEDILLFAQKNNGVCWGYAINGKTGEILWQRDQGVPASAQPANNNLPFGGLPAPIEDIDGDGESEIVITCPYHFALFKGKTGEWIKSINTMSWSDHELFPPNQQGFAAVTAVGEFLGNGQKQVLYTGTTYAMSLIDVSGEDFKSLWKDVHPLWAPDSMPGIGDIDGDGHVEVFSPGWRVKIKGHEGIFRCFDISDGEEKWRLPTDGACFGHNKYSYWNSPTMTVTSDLNGDGQDECYFGIDRKLYCVGVPKGEKTGRYLWTHEFPGRIGHPTPALINGRAAIIVTCEDGRIYMLR